MPPSAAPEWLRVGWSFEIIATSAPASCAAIAARMPAQPAPTTRTSWGASTAVHAIESGPREAPLTLPLDAGRSGPRAGAAHPPQAEPVDRARPSATVEELVGRARRAAARSHEL